ncbi:hypothetical protein [Longispora urticae]
MKPFGRSQAGRLTVWQSQALEHGLALEEGSDDACRKVPLNPPLRDQLLCPVCLEFKPFNQFSRDHAPPQGGQSRLGPACSVVMVCMACNSEAGFGFEREAAALLRMDEVDELENDCAVHGGLRSFTDEVTGLSIVVDELPFVLADLKAAYLLAFAVLGYRYARASEVDPIRHAIRAGRQPSAENSYTCKVGSVDTELGSVLMEVGGPYPCVIVRSESAAVVLPRPGTPIVPPPVLLTNVFSRNFPWPRTVEHARDDAVTRDVLGGTMFHADLCHTHWPKVFPRIPQLGPVRPLPAPGR